MATTSRWRNYWVQKVMAGDKFKSSVYGMKPSTTGSTPGSYSVMADIIKQLFGGSIAGLGKIGLSGSQISLVIDPLAEVNRRFSIFLDPVGMLANDKDPRGHFNHQ